MLPVQAGLLRGRSGPGCPDGALRRPGHVPDLADPRPGSRRTAARYPWRPSRPSPCAGPSPGRRSRAMACLTRVRRFDPRLARASFRCSRRRRVRSRGASGPGIAAARRSTGRRDDCYAPVDADHLAVAGAGTRFGDGGEGDMPAPGPVAGDPVGLHARRHSPGPAEPHPSGLRYPHLAGLAGYPAHLPLRRGLPASIRNPSSRPALRQRGRRAGLPGRRTRPSPGRSPAAPAAGPSGSRRASHAMLGPGLR